MAFLSVLFALMLEQFRPLPTDNPVYRAVDHLAAWFEHNFNTGEREHGALAWWLLVGGSTLAMLLLSWGIAKFGLLSLLGFNVVVLFLTLGFRQFSHPFTEIQIALESGNVQAARTVLGTWMQSSAPELAVDRLGPNEIARSTIERAMLLAHRHVFGVFFWFVVAGAAGAVMYRLAHFLAREWPKRASGRFGEFATRVFGWIDWLPVRMTAIGFAIVGNFEDAMYAWRNLATRWADPLAGIVLAAGAGALGVQLGTVREPEPAGASTRGLSDGESAEAPIGIEAQPGHLRSAVGLVWRAMVLWLILLLLLSIAAWIA